MPNIEHLPCGKSLLWSAFPDYLRRATSLMKFTKACTSGVHICDYGKAATFALTLRFLLLLDIIYNISYKGKK